MNLELIDLFCGSSSSESEDELDILLMSDDINIERDVALALKCKVKDNLEKISGFLSLIGEYTVAQFKSHFRLSRDTVKYIIDQYKTSLEDRLTFGREPVSPELKIYMTIWYLANQETFRQIADRFGVAISTCYEVIREITKYIIRESPNYIKWPHPEEYLQISTEFQKISGIKGAVGAIDGCHIRIRKPTECPMDYYNRKKYYSIVLQGVVNHQKKFIYVVCGEPGSMHDSRILQRTKIFRLAQEQNLFGNYFLLADSAYKNNEWLVAPFKDYGSLTEEQKTFNYLHSKLRIVVENAFGLLKGKFRKLLNFDNFNIEFIINCVMAACTLHNIYLIFEHDTDEHTDIIREEPVDCQNDNDDPEIDRSGHIKRNSVFQQMLDDNKLLNNVQ